MTSLERCCSEPRLGARVDAVVVHATRTPDAADLRDFRIAARLFRREGVSAHVINDANGLSARQVADDRIAYHATYWNRATLGIEQIGFPEFSRWEWLARRAQLDSTAAWLAYWARAHRLPIRRCRVEGLAYNRNNRVVEGVIARRGICTHEELDPRNRDDPGAAYPWDYVLRKARRIARAAG